MILEFDFFQVVLKFQCLQQQLLDQSVLSYKKDVLLQKKTWVLTWPHIRNFKGVKFGDFSWPKVSDLSSYPKAPKVWYPNTVSLQKRNVA